jgi:hypothetical protein
VAAFALSVAAAFLLAVSSSAQSGDGRVETFRARMEKWVETQKLISEEKADWEADREALESTRSLLKQQRESLEKSIAELEKTTTSADEERRALLLERGELQRSRGVLADRIRALETDVLALVSKFPKPLQEKLEPLLVQIPEDPDRATTPLGPRLMNVLGILGQAEKFDGTATLVGETRALDGDQKVQVRTLYWGLGQAFYIDSQQQHAGIGRPGPEGWEFADEPEFANAAARLLDIYEGNVDVIDFVETPVVIRESDR